MCIRDRVFIKYAGSRSGGSCNTYCTALDLPLAVPKRAKADTARRLARSAPFMPPALTPYEADARPPARNTLESPRLW
eukprot:7660100-Pyramimonas_sp.AAC.1